MTIGLRVVSERSSRMSDCMIAIRAGAPPQSRAAKAGARRARTLDGERARRLEAGKFTEPLRLLQEAALPVDPRFEDSQTLKRSIANIYPASPYRMVRPNGESARTRLNKWSASRAIIKIRVECAGSILQPI